jgi:hypothetical protein
VYAIVSKNANVMRLQQLKKKNMKQKDSQKRADDEETASMLCVIIVNKIQTRQP